VESVLRVSFLGPNGQKAYEEDCSEEWDLRIRKVRDEKVSRACGLISESYKSARRLLFGQKKSGNGFKPFDLYGPPSGMGSCGPGLQPVGAHGFSTRVEASESPPAPAAEHDPEGRDSSTPLRSAQNDKSAPSPAVRGRDGEEVLFWPVSSASESVDERLLHGLKSRDTHGLETHATGGYAPLHVASGYAFGRGTMLAEEIPVLAARFDMPAVAIADLMSLVGAVEFVKSAQKSGVKPLVGSSFEMPEGGEIVLIARSKLGYQSLSLLISECHLGEPRLHPLSNWERLERHTRDLLCLSGGHLGPVNRLLMRRDYASARSMLERLVDLYGRGNVFVEIERSYTPWEITVNERLLELADDLRLTPVAGGTVTHARREHFPVQDILTCVESLCTVDELLGRKPLRHPEQPQVSHVPERAINAERFLRTPHEMRDLFADRPDLVANTLLVAGRCDDEVLPARTQLPQLFEDDNHALREIVWRGALEKYRKITPRLRKRIEYELDRIVRLSFAGHFLTIWDACNWAKEAGILMSGRGSVVDSVVAYCLGFSRIDAFAHNLHFDRFLPEDGSKRPDIDIDFEARYRDHVREYLTRKYGEDRVATVAAVGTYCTRGIIREVGKAMGLSPEVIGFLAKRIHGGVSPDKLEAALEARPELRGSNVPKERFRWVFELAERLMDVPRNIRAHSSGVVISSRPLAETVPVMWSASVEPVDSFFGNEQAQAKHLRIIQWDKRSAKHFFDKFDILCLRGQDVLARTQEHIRAGSSSTGPCGTGSSSMGFQPMGVHGLPARVEGSEAEEPLVVREERVILSEGRSPESKDLVHEAAFSDRGSGGRDSSTPLRSAQNDSLLSSNSMGFQANCSEESLHGLEACEHSWAGSPCHPSHGLQTNATDRFNVEDLPLDDPETYRAMRSGELIGIPQSASPAMRQAHIRIRTSDLHDASLVQAGIRPGVGGSVKINELIARRRGDVSYSFEHPELENILGLTYGIIVFQEQVDQLLQTFCGYSSGKAEDIRDAIHKRRREDFGRQIREQIIGDILSNGYSQLIAEKVFDYVAGFKGYGFAQGHALAFAEISIRSIYCQQNFPAEYFAAMLSSQPAGYYGPCTLVNEARVRGVAILPVDVNRSREEFTVEDVKSEMDPKIVMPNAGIRVGLKQVKGLSEQTRLAVWHGLPSHGCSRASSSCNESSFEQLEPTGKRSFDSGLRPPLRMTKSTSPAVARKAGGDVPVELHSQACYTSIFDFVARVQPERDELEALILCGAFDSLHPNRRALLWALPSILEVRETCSRFPANSQQGALPLDFPEPDIDWSIADFSETEKAIHERAILDLDVERHLMSFERERVRAKGGVTAKEAQNLPNKTKAMVVGNPIRLRFPPTASGRRVVFFDLEDETGLLNVTCFDDVYQRDGHAIICSPYVTIIGEAQDRDGHTAFLAKRVFQYKPVITQDIHTLPLTTADFLST
jgi:DNA polymerase III alpha subunit